MVYNNIMHYFNLIFTNHALQRLSERRLSKELAWETFNKSDGNYKTDSGATAFYKKYDDFKTTIICKKNEKNEWVVISFWRDPPATGTKDAKKKEDWIKYKKSGFWGKIWIVTKQQLGL